MTNLIDSSLVSRVLAWLLAFLVLWAGYLYAFPQANIFYAAVVLLHLSAGLIVSILLAARLFRILKDGNILERAAWTLIAAGAVLGIVLIRTGTARAEWKWLYLHIAISLVGVGLLIAEKLRRRSSSSVSLNPAATVMRCALCLVVLAALAYASQYVRQSWQFRSQIQNPIMPPDNMNGEGDGPEGSFFPSSAQVYGKQKIPSKFFMESDSCKRCHEDIYNQWYSSAHHFS